MNQLDLQKIASVKSAAIAFYNSSKNTIDYDETSIIDVINRSIAFLNILLIYIETQSKEIYLFMKILK